MRTVLAFASVCYPYYPPQWASGAKRAAILARYLPEFGWRPIVITYPWGQADADWRECYAQAADKPSAIIPVDNGVHWAVRGQRWWRALAEKRPALRGIAKLATLLLWLPNWGVFDHERAGWHRVALQVGREIARLEQVDAIWATWMGWAPLWAADRLAIELSIPWIADIRDDWTTRILEPPLLARMAAASMVRRARRANLVTAVTQPLVELVRQRVHPDAHLIYNGYLPATEQHIEIQPDRMFTLVYTGSIPKPQEPSLHLLCQATRILGQENAKFAQKARFVYYGPNVDLVQATLCDYGLAARATVSGVVPYAKVCIIPRQSVILLLFIPPERVEAGMMTSKIFDYLAARRPILSVVGNSATVNPLLAETGAGQWADDVEAIVAILRKWFREWEQEGHLAYRGHAAVLERYGSRQQVARLAGLLDGLVGAPIAR